MKKAAWKKRIVESCEQAGTYRPYFENVIDPLADILEKRDDTADQYKKTGGVPVIKHTNKGGNANIVKNPMIVLWDDLNKSALAYWRDLGLTPAGLKKIDESAMTTKKRTSLEEVLADFGG